MRNKLEAILNTTDKPITIYTDSIAAFNFYTERATQVTLTNGVTFVVKLGYEDLKGQLNAD